MAYPFTSNPTFRARYDNYQIPEPPLSDALLAVERFNEEDLAVIRYTDAPDGLQAAADFFTLRLKPVREPAKEGDPTSDNEKGWGKGGTLHWVYEQLSSPYIGKFYNLRLVLYKPTMELVGVFGIVREDRGVLAENGLVLTLAFGYFQIDFRLRGKGLGNIFVRLANAIVQMVANETGIPIGGGLFTDEPPAKHLYEKNDWKETDKEVVAAGIAGVEGLPETEQLFVRGWIPGTAVDMPAVELLEAA